MGNVKNINLTAVRASLNSNVSMNFLAVFYLVKDRYVSGSFHNYTKGRLAKELGISPTTVEKSIKYGLSINGCRIENGSLIFNKLPKRAKNEVRGMRVQHSFPTDFGKMKMYLKSLLVVDKLRTMTYSRHSDLGKTNKRCGRNGWGQGEGAISYAKIANIMKCSKPIAVKIMNYADKSGMILKTVTEKKKGQSTSARGSFCYRGVIYAQPCNHYSEVKLFFLEKGAKIAHIKSKENNA